jgi:hypothetical protein
MPKKLGSRNYSSSEKARLVNEVCRILPIETEDWQKRGFSTPEWSPDNSEARRA